MRRCPHCGELLDAEPRPAAERVRWYIPDTGPARTASMGILGEKLLGAVRAEGQLIYESPDGGKTLRRVGIAAASTGERLPTEEREPIVLSPQELRLNWRPVGAVAKKPKPKTFRAGGGA